jgi:uncharacterized protein
MTADEIIRLLHLQPHPKEDGFFAETYRAAESISWEALPPRYDGSRPHSTAIYFLLKAGGFSEMHRLRSDEVFHFYDGAPAQILLLHSDGHGELQTLGRDWHAGERPQIVVPRHTWQGLRTTGEYTLMGTTVAPAFQYSDFESGQREKLTADYPQFADLIRQLTRTT